MSAGSAPDEASTPGCGPDECRWNCKADGRGCVRRTTRYLLTEGDGPTRRVGRDEWIAAERRIGFRGPAFETEPDLIGECACRSFSVPGLRGIRE